MFDVDYFRKFLSGQDELLRDIEKESLKKEIPIVGASLGKVLNLLVSISNPEHILELGTANGYSSIWMAKAGGFQGKITTVEYSEEMVRKAGENIEKAGLTEKIDVVLSGARDYLNKNESAYDMIFVDIEKKLYSEILEDCVEGLNPGGVMICDNVAFESVGDFNEKLDEHPGLETAFIYGCFLNHNPDEDAISVSFKKEGP